MLFQRFETARVSRLSVSCDYDGTQYSKVNQIKFVEDRL